MFDFVLVLYVNCSIEIRGGAKRDLKFWYKWRFGMYNNLWSTFQYGQEKLAMYLYIHSVFEVTEHNSTDYC